MCGILGFISPNQSDIESFKDSLYHRGPDDSGSLIQKIDDKFIHLLQTRLSILDLSSNAHQPFISECQNYIIIYNGEVYNFKDIKKELILLGYKFVSNSDTEVVLYSYIEWGIRGVDKFIGMFAFGILDIKGKKLTLIRDRAGVKPLYFYDNSIFIFGSELKSFYLHPEFKKNIEYKSLNYYLQSGYIPAPYTIWKNCYKLKAGHYLEYDLNSNSYEIKKYWDISDFYLQKKFDYSQEKIISDLEELLSDACNLRMVSDVPVGVFLSGGYDSSLVTALLAKEHKLNTFTIGFGEKSYDEAIYAKEIASYLGTNHTEYYCSSKDLQNFIQELPYYYDEPFGDSSAIPTMLVSKMAKKDVSVALSADGGDEAFIGYSKYFILNKFNKIHSKPILKKLLQTLLFLNENQISYLNSLLPNSLKQSNIRDKYNKFKRAVKAKDFEEMFINASCYIDPIDIKKLYKNYQFSSYEYFQKIKDLNPIDQMALIDYKTFMADDILTKVDRATMRSSLEGREPLIDHRIIEYLARVPTTLKYKNNQGKYLLREILYKHIPQNLVDRPKAGFAIPIYEWLKGDMKNLVSYYLNSDKIKKDGIFNHLEIQKSIKNYNRGEYININKIWFLLMFEMWREKWA